MNKVKQATQKLTAITLTFIMLLSLGMSALPLQALAYGETLVAIEPTDCLTCNEFGVLEITSPSALATSADLALFSNPGPGNEGWRVDFGDIPNIPLNALFNTNSNVICREVALFSAYLSAASYLSTPELAEFMQSTHGMYSVEHHLGIVSPFFPHSSNHIIGLRRVGIPDGRPGFADYRWGFVVVVAIQGSRTWGSEFPLTSSHHTWESNRTIHQKIDGDHHFGFYVSAREVYSNLRQFFERFRHFGIDNLSHTHIDADTQIRTQIDTQILITGHSRGGAIANLVGHWLNKDPRFGIHRNNIFIYTFGSPNVTTQQRMPVRNNIFNFVNDSDIVTMVPAMFADFDFRRTPRSWNRFGWDRFFSEGRITQFEKTHSMEYSYIPYLYAMKPDPFFTFAEDLSPFSIGVGYSPMQFVMIGSDTTTPGVLPVKLEIRDENDTLIGKVLGNEIISYYDNEILLFTHDNVIYLFMDSAVPYTLNFVATGSGAMNIVVTDSHAMHDNAVIGKVFENIPLYDGREMRGEFVETPNISLSVMDNGGTIAEIEGQTFNDETELYYVHIVTFNAGGGAVYPEGTLTGEDGTLVESLPTPTRDGDWEFNGWFTAATGGTQVTASTVFTADTTIFARWTQAGNNVQPHPPQPTPPKQQPEQPPPPGWRTMTDGAIAQRFDDINVGRWYTSYVAWAYANGITRGVGGGSEFRPTNNVTRAEFTAFLYRIAVGGTPPVSPELGFSDMNRGQWHHDYVAWAYSEGIVTGFTGDNTFRPNRPITREQLVAMLHRYIYNLQGGSASGKALNRFPDEGYVTGWARNYVNWGAYHGIIGATNPPRLNPLRNARRSETVAMLHRAVETFNLSPP